MKKHFRFSTKYFLQLAILVLFSSSLITAFGFEQTYIYGTPRQFSPSNAKTVNNQFIGVDQFFSAERCSYCHQDVYNAWSQSLHRNAAREPFYRESADILLTTRGIAPTQHCESCHTPIALLAGLLTGGKVANKAPFTPLDHEGVTCTICHSITEVRLDGTASYNIRPPALLVKEDGTPIYGDVPDSEIMANIPAHKRAMMRPLLRQPEFCATCHKVSSTPELNGYKQLLGFTAYDEWQSSGASTESIQSFYPRPERITCQGCHMPKVASSLDLARKDGKIALHRWPGANTAAPLFYGQDEQIEVTKNFLKNNVISVDILALQPMQNKNSVLPLSTNSDNTLNLEAGQEITAEVVVANRGAAHSFPPEVRDLYEAWVEFSVTDSKGQQVFHSGFVKEDGFLDETSHVYKTILLDKNSRTITRHQIWLTRIKAYDNAIQAGKADVVHYRFTVPQTDKFTLQAKVHYRRVNQEYANYVLDRQNRELTLPVVEMASTQTSVFINSQGSKPVVSGKNNKVNQPNKAEARRWNDYGIALLDQGQYGQAAKAFTLASQFDPEDAYLPVNIAIAEMRTERFGEEKKQFLKAQALLEKALLMSPNQSRAMFYKALVLRGLGQTSEAKELLVELATLHPRDREVLRQLAHTLYSLGDLAEARAALEKVLSIDPDDAPTYQLLSAIYESQGEKEKAQKAQELYLQWRQDPMADPVAAKFFASHPEWAEERINYHTHSVNAAHRPVLRGTQASPIDKPE